MYSRKYQEVWVYLESSGGRLLDAGLEVMGQGRRLADALGQRLAAVLIGEKVSSLAGEAIAAGAERIYLAEDLTYRHYTTDIYTAVMASLIRAKKPAALLLGATRNGRDLASRVACRLETGLTADCTGVDIDEETGLVVWTRPAFGGNVMAEIICPDRRPQMGTIRPGLFQKPSLDYARTGEVVCWPKPDGLLAGRTSIVETIQTAAAHTLEQAEIIVAGGRGMGSLANFALVDQLAAALHGVAAITRAVADEGWRPDCLQIGQSGKAVAPRLYIACGISGAVQHLAGIAADTTVIAVNHDPAAPIFKRADYAVVGDVSELLPLLIQALERKNSRLKSPT